MNTCCTATLYEAASSILATAVTMRIILMNRGTTKSALNHGAIDRLWAVLYKMSIKFHCPWSVNVKDIELNNSSGVRARVARENEGCRRHRHICIFGEDWNDANLDDLCAWLCDPREYRLRRQLEGLTVSALL